MNNGNQLIHSFNDHEGYQGNFKGLTKREYFAAMAMQGLLSSFTEKSATGNWQSELDEVAKTSVDFADELLKQLEK